MFVNGKLIKFYLKMQKEEGNGGNQTKNKCHTGFSLGRDHVSQEQELDCMACSAPCIFNKHLLEHSGVVST